MKTDILTELERLSAELSALYNRENRTLYIIRNNEQLDPIELEENAQPEDYWNSITLDGKVFDINLFDADELGEKYELSLYWVHEDAPEGATVETVFNGRISIMTI